MAGQTRLVSVAVTYAKLHKNYVSSLSCRPWFPECLSRQQGYIDNAKQLTKDMQLILRVDSHHFVVFQR